MITVETDRLLLRTLEEEDINALMSIWGDEYVMKYSGGAGNREREERGYSPYAVSLKENSELIGSLWVQSSL